MDRVLVSLIVTTLLALAAFGIRLIIRSTKPRSIKRWGSYAIISLIGLSLSTPVAFGHEYKEPGSDAMSVVSCELKDRDSEHVAQIIAEHAPALLNQITVGCHNLANDPLSKLCKLEPSAIGDMPACFISPPVVELFIIDTLARVQTKEWTEVALAKSQAGVALAKKPIDTFHLYPSKAAELLVIALPEAGSYDYSLTTDSYSNTSRCPALQKMSGVGTISTLRSSTYIVTGTSCRGTHVWLADWASNN